MIIIIIIMKVIYIMVFFVLFFSIKRVEFRGLLSYII